MTEASSLPPFNRKALIAFISASIVVLAFCTGLLPIPFTILICYPPGILFAIVSIVLGAQALREMRENNERGRSLALIALWTGGLMILAIICVITAGVLILPHISNFIIQLWNQVIHLGLTQNPNRIR